MCLRYIYSVHKRPLKRVVKGWKVFDVINKKLFFPYYAHRAKVKINVWLSAKTDAEGYDYPIGFHFFLTQEDANEWAMRLCNHSVREVKATDIVAKGKQGDMDCWVARKLLICKKVREVKNG